MPMGKPGQRSSTEWDNICPQTVRTNENQDILATLPHYWKLSKLSAAGVACGLCEVEDQDVIYNRIVMGNAVNLKNLQEEQRSGRLSVVSEEVLCQIFEILGFQCATFVTRVSASAHNWPPSSYTGKSQRHSFSLDMFLYAMEVEKEVPLLYTSGLMQAKNWKPYHTGAEGY
ncbi:hypothetical protein Trydic_g908 [Trypoxylus dichotomus]